MQLAELEALMGALADAAGKARTHFGPYDHRKVRFSVEASSIACLELAGCFRVDAVGEMRFDFGLEADGEWTQRETIHPVRFILEACREPILVASLPRSAELLGGVHGTWSTEHEALLCEPEDGRGHTYRVPSPRPPLDHVAFRVEPLGRSCRPDVPSAPAER